MSHASLTAKYRPQTFAQVAGQETVKSILSRAALEQRIAPAYLFSGTRGVGKTTLARIFAKALNCRNAPTSEPCNRCDQCRAITVGNAVDVVEIDGASNRGIDDVRRLKEVVGYAPMEGGFKIFIIDEAHMLSREAFNALLKTLEEPPARVTFLLATTEPHKFPATIVSRCQHYVFKPLSESGLAGHLSRVLTSEKLEFEENAVRLIARRGAGSVRDSLSLLGQVLALGEGKLTEEAARSVLGLAGQEAFLRLLDAVAAGDSLSLSSLLRAMLDQGLDIGFFLRELASLWRNLFLLRQSGEAALPVLDLPENESRRCLELARAFSLQQIHACWQMTLEGQRRVLTSLEPALALELLLLNLGMLPRLVSLESLSAAGRRGALSGKEGEAGTGASLNPVAGGSGSSGRSGMVPGPRVSAGNVLPDTAADVGIPPDPATELPPVAPDPAPLAGPENGEVSRQLPESASFSVPSAVFPEPAADAGIPPDPVTDLPPVAPDPAPLAGAENGEVSRQLPESASFFVPSAVFPEPAADAGIPPDPVTDLPPVAPDPAPFAGAADAGAPRPTPPGALAAGEKKKKSASRRSRTLSPLLMEGSGEAPAAGPLSPEEPAGGEESAPPATPPAGGTSGGTPAEGGGGSDLSLSAERTDGPDAPDAAGGPGSFSGAGWDDLLEYCARTEQPASLLSLLKRMGMRREGEGFVLAVPDEFTLNRAREPEIFSRLEKLFLAWCGFIPALELASPGERRKSREDLKTEILDHPLVREVQSQFGGYIIDYGQIR